MKNHFHPSFAVSLCRSLLFALLSFCLSGPWFYHVSRAMFFLHHPLIPTYCSYTILSFVLHHREKQEHLEKYSRNRAGNRTENTSPANVVQVRVSLMKFSRKIGELFKRVTTTSFSFWSSRNDDEFLGAETGQHLRLRPALRSAR